MTSGSTFAFEAHVSNGTVAVDLARGISSFAAHDWIRIAFEACWTRAGEIVIADRAESVRSTDVGNLTWILAGILNANLIRWALKVLTTPNVAVSFRNTGLVR